MRPEARFALIATAVGTYLVNDYFFLGRGIGFDYTDPDGFLATLNPLHLNTKEAIGGLILFFEIALILIALGGRGKGLRREAAA